MATSGGNFLNLDEIVRNAAWEKFDSSATGKQKKLRRKDKRDPRSYLHLELDWSEAIFHDETRWNPLTVEDQTASDAQNDVTQGMFQPLFSVKAKPGKWFLFQAP